MPNTTKYIKKGSMVFNVSMFFVVRKIIQALVINSSNLVWIVVVKLNLPGIGLVVIK